MTKRRFFLTVCTLTLCASVWGQIPSGGLQRSVEYKTSTCKTFKIGCDVVVAELSPLDFIYLEAKPAMIRFSKFVIANDWLTITNCYPQMPRYERDYEFQMGKSVTDKWGTKLYYHDGEEYYNLENETEDEQFLKNGDEIGSYGVFNGLFDVSIDTLCGTLDSAGIPHYRWGQKLLIVLEETDTNFTKRTEIETDFEQLYFETRTFVDNVHQFSNRTEYKKVNGFVIPTKSKRVYYSELPSETRYQITEIESYLSYMVKDGSGDILVEVAEDALADFSISITPDPAQDEIQIHFDPSIEGSVNVKITNAANITVWEQETFVAGDELIIDISLLESGFYTVQCTYNEQVADANFLKDGIGTYEEPDPMAMVISVAPNPATGNITVTFPVQINAPMFVKITDIMGIAYYENDVYIAGNTLSLNVNFLPAGMYYIICMKNDDIATAKFLKQ